MALIIYEFLIKGFKVQAQMLNRIPLARNQGLDVLASAVSDLLKGLVFQFVPDEGVSLVFRQFLQGSKKRFPEKLPQVLVFWCNEVGKQQVVELRFAVLVFVGEVVEAVGLALAGAVGEFIPSHPEEPCPDVLHGFQLNELAELEPHVLQHVLGIGIAAHPWTDEAEQALAVAAHRLYDVLAFCHGGGFGHEDAVFGNG